MGGHEAGRRAGAAASVIADARDGTEGGRPNLLPQPGRGYDGGPPGVPRPDIGCAR